MKVEFFDAKPFGPDVLKLAKFFPLAKKFKEIDLYVPKHLKKFSRVTATFIDAAQSKALNDKYREKNKPTDVLSFEMFEGDLLGELYICIDEVKANAKYFKANFDSELVDVIVHGCLHLLGFDHEGKMFKIQHKIRDAILDEYETPRRTWKPRKGIRKN